MLCLVGSSAMITHTVIVIMCDTKKMKSLTFYCVFGSVTKKVKTHQKASLCEAVLRRVLNVTISMLTHCDMMMFSRCGQMFTIFAILVWHSSIC